MAVLGEEWADLEKKRLRRRQPRLCSLDQQHPIETSSNSEVTRRRAPETAANKAPMVLQ